MKKTRSRFNWKKTPTRCGEKGHFGMAGLECIADANNPVPVAVIYAIDTSHGMVMDRRPLRGKERFNFLDSQAHRSWMGRALGSHQDIFRQLAALSRAVPVYRLQRPRSLQGMEEATAFLRQMHPDMAITPPLLNSEEFTSGEQHDR
ncbi:MAG: hypothetical protein HY881_21655 [Deltaproteobacteria bacterium]|nr:hypothetical protein [Deltaproteobacteria bacterium]